MILLQAAPYHTKTVNIHIYTSNKNVGKLPPEIYEGTIKIMRNGMVLKITVGTKFRLMTVLQANLVYVLLTNQLKLDTAYYRNHEMNRYLRRLHMGVDYLWKMMTI